MFYVEMYFRVRRACLVEGMSVREASRVFDLHRDTVRKMLDNATPQGYTRQSPPRKPKLEPYTCPASTIFAGWRQSVLPVHLLGLDALLGSVGPVAGDVKLQDDGVVHDPVNRRGGGHGVGEDALPLREDQV